MVRQLRRTVLAGLAAAGLLSAGAVGLHAVADPGQGVGQVQGRAAGVACRLHVTIRGSDAQGDGSVAKPFRTPQRMLRALPAGATGCLSNGRYPGDVTLRRDRTTLRSAPGQRAVLAALTLTIPAGVDGAAVTHLDLVGRPGGATVRAVGDGFRLERNDITNGGAGDTCVLVGASDHRTSGGRIVENVIHGCGRTGSHFGHGIYAQNSGPAAGPGAAGLLVEGNVLYDNAAYAVQLFPRTASAVVRRNVIDGGGRSVRGGIVIDGPMAAGHRIEGNLIARAPTAAIVQRTGRGHLSRDNCLWRNADEVDAAQGVDGPGLVSSGDRADDACWLPEASWQATGSAAAAEPCVCPTRALAPCSGDQEGALCRLLRRSQEES